DRDRSSAGMRHRRTAILGLVALLLTVGLAGCGRYVRSGSQPEPTDPPQDVSVGSGIDLRNVTTTTAPAPAKVTTTAPRTQSTAAQPTTPNPVTVEGDGFRIKLEVDGGTRHKADQPFTMRMVITNVSGEARQYDPNQRTFFVMETGDGSASWRDSDCKTPPPGGQEAKTLPAGESLTIEARYPGPAERLDNSDSCRRPPAGYSLSGGLVWCPKGTIFGGQCDPSGSRTAAAGVIGISLL
ncbi:MAG: hypothetical protein ACR2H3_12410, partial [Acidimicrobiales bacterium]